MYIAPGQGCQPLVDKICCQQELRTFVASFKKISFKSDFIQFFHDFIHVYSPGAGAVSPRGQNFDVNKNVLSLHLLQV